VSDAGKGPDGPGGDFGRRKEVDAGSGLRFCRAVLPSVSRTFALTIRVLPPGLRDSVTVAYLLCRMADHLEDSVWAPPRSRIAGLRALEALLEDPGLPHSGRYDEVLASPELLSGPGSGSGGPSRRLGSGILLARRDLVFAAFRAQPPDASAVIARWVREMASGMGRYVGRECDEPVPRTLATRDDLFAYCWCVAGTVGHLLTDLFLARLGPEAAPVASRLRELAEPFGRGLQVTNVLQDIAEDRGRGWVYVPEEMARRRGISARDLGDPGHRDAGLRVVGDLVLEAAGLLDRAMEYTLLLPRRAARIRLFCALPVVFAVRTLGRIWGEPRVLEGGGKVRISRGEVRGLLAASLLNCAFDRGLRRLYRRERSRLDRLISACPL